MAVAPLSFLRANGTPSNRVNVDTFAAVVSRKENGDGKRNEVSVTNVHVFGGMCIAYRKGEGLSNLWS